MRHGRDRRSAHASLCVQRSLFGLCHRLRRLLEGVLKLVDEIIAPGPFSGARGGSLKRAAEDVIVILSYKVSIRLHGACVCALAGCR